MLPALLLLPGLAAQAVPARAPVARIGFEPAALDLAVPGGANVRVQGLRGRYTLILADGLPLHGAQTGVLGLLLEGRTINGGFRLALAGSSGGGR